MIDGLLGYILNCRAVSTHPDIATLVTPLSASRIEGIFFSPRVIARRNDVAIPYLQSGSANWGLPHYVRNDAWGESSIKPWHTVPLFSQAEHLWFQTHTGSQTGSY